MGRYAHRFDAAGEVRLVGPDTDLRLCLAGRSMKVDAASANMPGGEFFGCPLEDSAAGVIAFSEFPATYAGREVTGIRLRFEDGVVVDASAWDIVKDLRRGGRIELDGVVVQQDGLWLAD